MKNVIKFSLIVSLGFFAVTFDLTKLEGSQRPRDGQEQDNQDGHGPKRRRIDNKAQEQKAPLNDDAHADNKDAEHKQEAPSQPQAQASGEIKDEKGREDKKEEKDTCSFCITNLDEVDEAEKITLPCKHQFCFTCIHPWAAKCYAPEASLAAPVHSEQCPLCRKIFNIHEIYKQWATKSPDKAVQYIIDNIEDRLENRHRSAMGLFLWLPEDARKHAQDLLQKKLGLNLDQKKDEKTGNTQLHNAASHSNQDGAYIRANVLIHCGLAIDAKNSAGKTPLTIATEKKHQAVAQLLQANMHLLIHASNGNFDGVKAALKVGACVNLQDSSGVTPLFLAAQNGHFPIVHLLLHNGAAASVNLQDSNGATPLSIAAQQGHYPIVQLLLQNDAAASVNLQNSKGVTPLSIAAEKGHFPIVELLLQNGATDSVNLQDSNGVTPLLIAAQNRHFPVVQLLLKNGAAASVNLKDNRGATPLLIAAQQGHFPIVELLLKNGATDSVNLQTSKGVTPLLTAAMEGHFPVVQLLLQNGANAKIVVKGYTVLAFVQAKGHTAIVELLQSHGS